MDSDDSLSTIAKASRQASNATELISLGQQWQEKKEDPVEFAFWMASSEVDQKFLGYFATSTSLQNPFLSGMLYKVLGLSVILSKKLVRARKRRRLDPTRETKSLQLYHHIIWLSREGLIMVEQYILPMVADYVEMKVLAYKLRASFYHIFVLFHNKPSIHLPNIHSVPPPSSHAGMANGVSNGGRENGIGLTPENRGSIIPSPPLPSAAEGGPVGGRGGGRGTSHSRPPGLPVTPQYSASFILPALDYVPTATACFNSVASLADRLLPGSHPIRLSVKLEYAAYIYDCLHDSDSCRRLAKQAIADVYNAQEGMDDESFEDAADLVGILGKMVKRGGKTSSTGGSSTPGAEKSRSEGSRRSTPPQQQQQQQQQPTRPKEVADLNRTPQRSRFQNTQPPTSPPTAPIVAKRTPTKSKPTSRGVPVAVPDPNMVNPI